MRAFSGFALFLLLTRSEPVIAGGDTGQPAQRSPAVAAAVSLFDSSGATRDTDPPLSLQYALRGLDLLRGFSDPRLLAAGYQLVSDAHFQLGNNDSAEFYSGRALELAKESKSDSLAAAALNSIGLVAYLRGNYDVAYEHCTEALALAQRAGLTRLEVRAYNYLGLSAQYLGERHDDLSYFLRALPPALASGDSDGIAITHNHLGNWYGARQMLDSAMAHYFQALAVRQRIERNTNSLSVVLNNIGNIFRQQGNPQAAEEYYQRSLAISRKTGNKNLMATTFKNLAILSRTRKEYPRALAYAREAKEISKAVMLPRVLLQSAEEIVKIYAEQGDYPSAYRSLMEYTALEDSLENEVIRRRAAELQIRFESERQERQIQELALSQERLYRNFLIAIFAVTLLLGAVLYREYRQKSRAVRETALQKAELERLYGELVTNNRRLLESESGLRDSLREKEILLKEIHHRVKNNLQVISSLLTLQSFTVNDRQFVGLLRESQDRIRSMALIHEQLYRSNDFSRIDLKSYLLDLLNHLRNSYSSAHAEIVVEAETPSLSLDTAIPLGLIVSELVSNAFKHAFPQGGGGQVRVSVRALEGGECELVVKDTGKGLPADLDLKDTSTLGLQLVQVLVQQLEGRLIARNDNGASFTIFFPRQEKS